MPRVQIGTRRGQGPEPLIGDHLESGHCRCMFRDRIEIRQQVINKGDRPQGARGQGRHDGALGTAIDD